MTQQRFQTLFDQLRESILTKDVKVRFPTYIRAWQDIDDCQQDPIALFNLKGKKRRLKLKSK